jgi:hypothetical protein
MSKPRIFTTLLGVAVLLTLASSARADVVRTDMNLERVVNAEKQVLAAFDSQRAETAYLYSGHVQNNTNGKNLGFSMTAVNRGPRLGIVKPKLPGVSQNPEPTAMVLLGTGLAAVAAFARKKSRKRRT